MTMKEIRIGDTVQIRRGVCGEGYRFRVSEREISLVAIDRSAIVLPVKGREAIAELGRNALTTIDYWAARALGYRIGKHGGIVVGGCGMDMGFHLVYNLGRTLWPTGTDNPHGRRNGHPDSDGGYALKHGWL